MQFYVASAKKGLDFNGLQVLKRWILPINGSGKGLDFLNVGLDFRVETLDLRKIRNITCMILNITLLNSLEILVKIIMVAFSMYTQEKKNEPNGTTEFHVAFNSKHGKK